ncbi:MAG: hypothetical protein AAGA10_12630 [Bacteroidota bacterium]
MGKAIRGNGVKNTPPYLPVNFFVRNFSPAQKVSFALALVILGFLAVYIFWSSVYPLAWTPTFQSLAEAYKTPVEIGKVHTPYISLPLTFPVYQSWVSFYAGPMLPMPSLIITFVVLQTLAWTLWVTTATYIRSRWAYGVYFLYLFNLFLSNTSQYIFPGLSFPLIEVGISIPLLTLVYIFQAQKLRMGFWGRFLAFFLVQSFLFGYLYYLGSWKAWYFTFINQFYYQILLTFLFFLFVSKELLNLFILLGNNRSNPQKIWPISVYRLLWLPLLVGLFFFTGSFTTLGSQASTVSVLSYVLLGGFAILTPFTSQNLFRVLKPIFSAHSVWALLLVSWAIIVLSFCGLQLSMGDILLSQTLGKIFIQLLFVGTLCYVIYVETNFFQFLNKRLRIFFLLAKGPAFPFGVMYLPAILLFFFFQGQEDWKALRVFAHSQLILEGDAQGLAQQPETAIGFYAEATNYMPFSPKAQYNQGAFLMRNPQRTGLAIEAFKRALRLYDFPQARLNASQLFGDLQLTGSSQGMLKEGLVHSNTTHGRLAHNLALSFWREKQWDSALHFFHIAQELDPHLYITQIHMAKLYYERGQDSLAREYWEKSLNGIKGDEQVAINVLYYAMVDSLLRPPLTRLSEDIYTKSLVQNVLFAEFAEGEWEKAREQSQLIVQNYEEPEMELLYGYLEMERGSLAVGKSKLEYLSQRYPALTGLGNYLLGISYFEKGIWGMATKYFRRSAEAGMGRSYYFVRVLEGLQGKEVGTVADSVEDDIWAHLLEEEEELIRMAARDTLSVELDKLDFQEKQRLASYSLYQNQCYIPVQILSSMGEEAVFREASMNILASCRTEAFLQFLKQQAQAHPASNALRQIVQFVAEDPLEIQDSLGIQLQENWEKRPWDEEIGVKWVAHLLREGQVEDAHTVLTQILEINDQNPVFWEQYQQIMEAWGMTDEMNFAEEQIDKLTP